jgi:hypothetical protein
VSAPEFWRRDGLAALAGGLDLAWQRHAACATSPGFSLWPVPTAFALCHQCRVLTECRSWAQADAYTGVAGGQTFLDGVGIGEIANQCEHCGQYIRKGARTCGRRPCRTAADRAIRRKSSCPDCGAPCHRSSARCRSCATRTANMARRKPSTSDSVAAKRARDRERRRRHNERVQNRCLDCKARISHNATRCITCAARQRERQRSGA